MSGVPSKEAKEEPKRQLNVPKAILEWIYRHRRLVFEENKTLNAPGRLTAGSIKRMYLFRRKQMVNRERYLFSRGAMTRLVDLFDRTYRRGMGELGNRLLFQNRLPSEVLGVVYLIGFLMQMPVDRLTHMQRTINEVENFLRFVNTSIDSFMNVRYYV